MSEIVLSAEVAYIKHTKDRGVTTLIAWFRAELTYRDESTQERLGALPDTRLGELQDHVESLADRWRSARQSQQEKKFRVA
jgi:hypothetical protein